MKESIKNSRIFMDEGALRGARKEGIISDSQFRECIEGNMGVVQVKRDSKKDLFFIKNNESLLQVGQRIESRYMFM